MTLKNKFVSSINGTMFSPLKILHPLFLLFKTSHVIHMKLSKDLVMLELRLFFIYVYSTFYGKADKIYAVVLAMLAIHQ